MTDTNGDAFVRALRKLRTDFTLTNARTFTDALIAAPRDVFSESPLTYLPRAGEAARSSHVDQHAAGTSLSDLAPITFATAKTGDVVIADGAKYLVTESTRSTGEVYSVEERKNVAVVGLDLSAPSSGFYTPLKTPNSDVFIIPSVSEAADFPPPTWFVTEDERYGVFYGGEGNVARIRGESEHVDLLSIEGSVSVFTIRYERFVRGADNKTLRYQLENTDMFQRIRPSEAIIGDVLYDVTGFLWLVEQDDTAVKMGYNSKIKSNLALLQKDAGVKAYRLINAFATFNYPSQKVKELVSPTPVAVPEDRDILEESLPLGERLGGATEGDVIAVPLSITGQTIAIAGRDRLGADRFTKYLVNYLVGLGFTYVQGVSTDTEIPTRAVIVIDSSDKETYEVTDMVKAAEENDRVLIVRYPTPSSGMMKFNTSVYFGKFDGTDVSGSLRGTFVGAPGTAAVQIMSPDGRITVQAIRTYEA